jgi:hypothetical protein
MKNAIGQSCQRGSIMTEDTNTKVCAELSSQLTNQLGLAIRCAPLPAGYVECYIVRGRRTGSNTETPNEPQAHE